MDARDLSITLCVVCAVVCLVTTLINVKLFTEWVKHGILGKGK